MTKDIKKRFIAGATCPSCGLQDKTVVYLDDSQQYHLSECVRCGHTQKATDKKKPSSKKIIWLNKTDR